jgi:hypothetical protein
METVREVYRPADPVVVQASAGAPPPAARTSAPARPAANPVSVTAVSAKIQRVSSSYAYYAFQVAISNHSPEPVKKMVKVRLLDGKGYEIASRSIYETYAPGSRTYTDTVMVEFEKAKEVRSASAEVSDGNEVRGTAPRLDASTYRP